MSKEENNTGYIQLLQLGLSVITIYTAISFLNKIFGDGQAGEENEQNEYAAARARQKYFQAIPPSYSDDVYRDWADTLDTALLRHVDENEDAVFEIFKECKNISDVAKLIEFFGHRREMYSTYNISLPQAISTMFDASEKLRLNAILFKKGIQYRFK